jgi:hypothetical protein
MKVNQVLLHPGHNILWEMGENGQKEEALIIIPFFN